MVTAHCPDPRCECPDERCAICCWCTCPPGWLSLNSWVHRGPKACPQYDIDQHRRDKHRATGGASCTDCDGNLEDGQRWRCLTCQRASAIAIQEAKGRTVYPSDIARARVRLV